MEERVAAGKSAPSLAGRVELDEEEAALFGTWQFLHRFRASSGLGDSQRIGPRLLLDFFELRGVTDLDTRALIEASVVALDDVIFAKLGKRDGTSRRND